MSSILFFQSGKYSQRLNIRESDRKWKIETGNEWKREKDIEWMKERERHRMNKRERKT